MFFVELDDDGITLADIKRIAQHIADDYEHLVKQLTQDDLDDLSFILKPTLRADHNEVEIRKRWNDLVKDFKIINEHGKTLKFFVDDNNKLYFGDKEGMSFAKAFELNTDYPKNNFHSE